MVSKRMLAPSCLTSLDRRKINIKHTVEICRNLKTHILRLILYQEHSISYTWHVHGSLHSSRPMIRCAARTPLPKSATSVVPLHHFSRNARKWAVLKSLSKRNEWLVSSHTAMRYLPFLPPLPSPAVPVMGGILFISQGAIIMLSSY